MRIIQRYAGACLFIFLFGCSLLGRTTVVSLDRQAPDTVEAEIKGAVRSPGVYTLKNGSDVEDLIQAAGGELENADLSAIRLQEKVSPGQIIVVGKTAMDGSSPLISINTATVEELMNLPGIGEAMARRIAEYRNQKTFESLEELMEVKGIGEKKFEKLKEFISL